MTDVTSLLKESGAMLEGHFLLSSGRHSDRYFQCALLTQFPDKAASALEGVARNIKADMASGKLAVDVIAGPAMGGVIAAYELARQLGLPAIFTERDEKGIMCLRRGFRVKPGERVLIADDVFTTGKSSGECAAALEACGAVIEALACIVDRGQPGVERDWPLYSAVAIGAANWEASNCVLCGKGIPAIKPGSRK